MTTAAPLRSTPTGPRLCGSRLASPSRRRLRAPCCHRARPTSRPAARKLASGFLTSRPPTRARQVLTQSLGTHQGNAVFWYEVVLGCVVYLNSTGAVVAATEYSPYGRVTSSYGSTSNYPIGYSGQYTDSETGLVYYGARYYNPKHGRFVNRDPIEEQGGNNLYAFCHNNSTNSWDVLGMDDKEETAGGGFLGWLGRVWRGSGNSGPAIDTTIVIENKVTGDRVSVSIPGATQSMIDSGVAAAHSTIDTFDYANNGSRRSISMIDDYATLGHGANGSWFAVTVMMNSGKNARGQGPLDPAKGPSSANKFKGNSQGVQTVAVLMSNPFTRKLAIDKALVLYGINTNGISAVNYDPSYAGDASTSSGGVVTIGEAAFLHSPGWLGSTLGHEIEVHYQTQAQQGRWWTDSQGTAMQEVQAYDYEIRNSVRFGTTATEIKLLQDVYRKPFFDSLNFANRVRAGVGDFSTYAP